MLSTVDGVKAGSTGEAGVFGASPRVPRQVLLLIVFGVLLAVVGVTATAQAVMVTVYSSSSTLNATLASDLATIRGFVHQGLSPSILEPNGLSAQEQAALEGLIGTIESKGEILRVELRLPDGRVLAASDSASAGSRVEPSQDFARALTDGNAQVALIERAAADAAPGFAFDAPQLLREYLPLRIGDEVVLVVGVWRDAAPLLGRLDDLRRDVVLVTITAALIASITLYLVFRGAQARLARQAEALLEASRRDPLTGMLNHGALVGLLAAEVERARAAGSSLGVALIDLDGFRLLNDNHGHRAGDDALLAVSELLEATCAGQLLLGRYGPDEFLLVSTTHDGEALQSVVDDIRAGLAGVALQFESTERMPLTVSAGLCTYPIHGASVTTLLSAAVRTLEDAKSGGGNSVRVAQVEDELAATGGTSFDILQGLVIAVDKKDRYTKRHSEDVARYAVFIAERLGLDEELTRTIRLAGLLHDVGKIGIPDAILRKPGRLTSVEEQVIRQHVALGDSIVRDLPDIETIRAGVRHHHERWDGTGYLERLEGEGIPLVARILSVGDVFSAMTTTRPYRKALGVEEAMRRLGDAAGTQLDAELVKTFLDGIESAEDPPLPDQGPAARLARLHVA
jgi:diguanylate cyclase (GGDEF)-like protein/putative nucleotidyltransferase with HDIG domain